MFVMVGDAIVFVVQVPGYGESMRPPRQDLATQPLHSCASCAVVVMRLILSAMAINCEVAEMRAPR
eukprot:scaffold247175_cov56-Cyclotella_meneghiniana.AAC.1